MNMRYALLAVVALWGCGGGDGDDDGPAADCADRCVAKVVECGDTAANAQTFCQSFCGDEPTEAQLSCAEGKTCEQLQTEENVCGIGADGGGACPELSGCACGISGQVQINGRCAQSCEEACAALSGALGG
ncbi:MAG: hypothetical protein H6706_14985 [Myxococcales bacterium]|nr:hypothetical protein [Myxococcales bacterium]